MGLTALAFQRPLPSATESFACSFWMQSTRVGDYPVYEPYSWLWFVNRTEETVPLVNLAILNRDVQTSRKAHPLPPPA